MGCGCFIAIELCAKSSRTTEGLVRSCRAGAGGEEENDEWRSRANRKKMHQVLKVEAWSTTLGTGKHAQVFIP